MNVTDAQIVALREAASDGISLDGLRVTVENEMYTFATLDEEWANLSETEFTEVAKDNTEYVTNWHFWTQSDLTEEKRAYLQWLERADEYDVPKRYGALDDGNGVERTWGDLHITTTLRESGQRRYALCNETDREHESDDLETYDDPLDARQIAKYDDDGRYRPLKTAPTLQTGWQFTHLTGAKLLQTIDFFYPATVQNWYLEQHDALDVSHWRETAERQTGIYGIIDELDQEAVEWLTQACCVDSQCLKRRQWDEDRETPLDVPRGEGEFPCREPCSLVINAARTWTLLEREQAREYTFSLTPSEKEQVETIIEAVADGRVDDIREADMNNGANRYRARYLRAKQFDEDGQLNGVPTDPNEHE
jgi:hypothetical protein